MSDTKISALPASTTPLAGTEVLPIVQAGTTVKVAVSDLTAGRSVSGTSFVPTGSSVPANGMYLSAANSVAFATNSTFRGRFDANGNFGLGITSSITGSGSVLANNDYTTAYAADLGANASSYGYGSQTAAHSLSDSSTVSGISLFTRSTGLSRWDILNVWTNSFLGDLVFRARTGGSATAEIVRFKSNTDVSIVAGNLSIATAGKGIQFAGNNSVLWRCGAGSPEGSVTAPVGSLYTRTDGGANTTLYVKESGSGNTGWIAK